LIDGVIKPSRAIPRIRRSGRPYFLAYLFDINRDTGSTISHAWRFHFFVASFVKNTDRNAHFVQRR
jgi:hypothetical protein